MQDIKVITYEPQVNNSVKGVALIEAGGKWRVVVKVLLSKAGNFFCKFSSSKVGDEWIPNFEFVDKDFQRDFLNSCLELLMPMIGSGKPKAAPIFEDRGSNADHSNDNLPF